LGEISIQLFSFQKKLAEVKLDQLDANVMASLEGQIDAKVTL
jgi:hypothetical protein